MSLLGQGAVAIWFDCAPDQRDEYYAWHGEEHMPERVAVPGFLRSRRYVALNGRPEFFILHETSGFEAVSGPDYLRSLNNPSVWTVAMMKASRNVLRSICHVEGSKGRAQGGLLATWRYDVPDAAAKAHREAVAARLIPKLAATRQVAGAHFLVADAKASGVETAEQKARGAKSSVPRWIFLVEGWGDSEPFDRLCRETIAESLRAQGAANAEYGLYRLQVSMSKPG